MSAEMAKFLWKAIERKEKILRALRLYNFCPFLNGGPDYVGFLPSLLFELVGSETDKFGVGQLSVIPVPVENLGSFVVLHSLEISFIVGHPI